MWCFVSACVVANTSFNFAKNSQTALPKNYLSLVCQPESLILARSPYGCRQRFAAWRSGGFFAQKFNRRTNVEPCTNVQSKTFSPAFGNTLLCSVFSWEYYNPS